MSNPIDERPRGRRRFRNLAAVFTATLLAAGVSAVVLGSTTATAANLTITQCNGIHGGGGQTTACDVTVENWLTDDPLTTHSVVTVNNDGAVSSTPSGDLITGVNQCNGSSDGAGSTLHCTVHIINHIAIAGALPATAATINQCQSNQDTDGLGMDLVNTCSPTPANANTSGATITQCNGTGNGGGLVSAGIFSHCTASGTVSASLPMLVNQCNASANGGGEFILCEVTITTDVTDTSVVSEGGGPTTPPFGGTGGGTGTPGSGVPGVVRPVVGVPGLTG
jgi:hypothetical protein